MKDTRENIYIPSDFITSERYYQARLTSAMPYYDIKYFPLENWFLSRENIDYMRKQINSTYLNSYNKDLTQDKIDENKKKVKDAMELWATNKKINRYMEAPVIPNPFTRSSNMYRYFMIALSEINTEFYVDYHGGDFRLGDDEYGSLKEGLDWNPYKAYANIANKNEFEDSNQRVKLEDLVYSVENTRNMDVWHKQQVIRSNKNFRYGNAIPVWQKAGSANRAWGLDRSNDGFHDGNPDRASLENQIHGYILGDITGDPKRSIYDLTNLQWPEEKGVNTDNQYFDQADYQVDTTDYYYDQFPYDG